jgi:hypothetical protein
LEKKNVIEAVIQLLAAAVVLFLGYWQGLETGWKKGAASRELICTRCGFSAPLLVGQDHASILSAHYQICPAGWIQGGHR